MVVSQLSIVFWNCRSVRNKYVELFDLLCTSDIDICLLSETWLKSTNKLFHPNYSCVRNDRVTSSGGGVAILVKKTIGFNEIPNLNTKTIENVGIEINCNDNKIIKLYSVYFPGGSPSHDLRKEFKNDLRILFNTKEKIIYCGDFNSKHRDWGCLRANTWGNILKEFTTFYPITIAHTDNPTYVPPSSRSSPSNIDLVLSNVPTLISHPIVVYELSSDHLPVKFNLSVNNHHFPNLVWDYANTKWDGFKKCLTNSLKNMSYNLEGLNTTDNINKNIEFLSNQISKAVRDSVPKKIPENNFLKLPCFILNLIKTPPNGAAIVSKKTIHRCQDYLP